MLSGKATVTVRALNSPQDTKRVTLLGMDSESSFRNDTEVRELFVAVLSEGSVRRICRRQSQIKQRRIGLDLLEVALETLAVNETNVERQTVILGNNFKLL